MKPTRGKRWISNDTVPVNQAQQQLKINHQREQVSGVNNQEKVSNFRKFPASKEAQSKRTNVEEFERNNSRRLTICLISFVASLTCLSPYLSLHSTQRIGLLLFESDLIQLRSSLISVIILAVILVILYATQVCLSTLNGKTGENLSAKRSLLFQKILKQLIGFFAIISAVSYLSLTLIVPQIRQIQRMPLATFDCNANLITIENCHQQFSSNSPEQTLTEALEVLYLSDLGGKRDKLIDKFNCLKYNDKDLEKLQVPTRFLLHHCTLVCKPQRQQLHQFGDDLNQDQNWPSEIPKSTPQQPRLVPPYQRHELNRGFESTKGEGETRSTTYYNNTANSNLHQTDLGEQDKQQVSLRVCFSGEFTGGSNYKQYCITNLAHNDHSHALTVGQLNAMLRRVTPAASPDTENHPSSGLDTSSENQQQHSISAASSAAQIVDQTTHYVNPIVQFESHFKNWPHLNEDSITPHLFDNTGKPISVNDPIERNELGHQDSWCKFKPIPPLIVNNRPFNDIQCSLEHEYTMTTGPSIDSTAFRGTSEKIFLKKSNNEHESSSSGERCNIQCKVNILYQIHVADESGRSARETARGSVTERVNLQHYYLPLKPCLIMSGSGDNAKSTTANYYLIFRSLGDSTLLIVFILLDVFLLLESIDTKQSPLESKKYRLSGLLLTVTLMPLIIGLLFDLTSLWSPYTSASRARKEQPGNQLLSFLYESIQTSFSDIFSQRSSPTGIKKTQKSSTIENRSNSSSYQQMNLDPEKSRSPMGNLFDNYLVPFFIYAVCMFLIAINSLSLPLISPATPLLRVSSIEELGMSKSTGKQYANIKKKAERSVGPHDTATAQENGVKKLAHIEKSKRRTTRMISFAAIALFMGTQFNLSQIIQTQIIFESFSNPSNEQSPASITAFLFALSTHSSASLFVLCIVLIFSEETSAFFSRLSVFKMSLLGNVNDDEEESTGRSRISFLKHLTFAIFVYSVRFILLANIRPTSRFKWLLVFVVQVAELINFPTIWFATCARLHELLLIIRKKNNKHQELISEESTKDASSISVHIIGRSLLSFGYFVLGRFIALTAHSLHTSVYLHSDNVDWFITSFYGATENNNEENQDLKSSKDYSSVTSSLAQDFHSNNSNSHSSGTEKSPDSLFSPLPNERQTYLYASKLFLKYNSLVCLIIGMIPLLMLVYVKYQIWSRQKRTFDMRGFAGVSSGSDLRERTSGSCIDERIGYDLMQIHAATGTTRTIPPRVIAGKRKHKRKHGPRANILFHYNLDTKQENSSDISSTSVSDDTADKKLKKEPSLKSQQQFEIPMAFEEEKEDPLDKVEQEKEYSQTRPSNQKHDLDESEIYQLKPEPPEPFRSSTTIPDQDQPKVIERIVRYHRKRIQIVEEEEEEEEEEDNEILHLRDDENQNDRKKDSLSQLKAKKRISFAPKATLIDNYQETSSTESSRKAIDRSTVMMPKRASPEPSIGNESDYDYDDD